jgi:hypothetical protein
LNQRRKFAKRLPPRPLGLTGVLAVLPSSGEPARVSYVSCEVTDEMSGLVEGETLESEGTEEVDAADDSNDSAAFLGASLAV